MDTRNVSGLVEVLTRMRMSLWGFTVDLGVISLTTSVFRRGQDIWWVWYSSFVRVEVPVLGKRCTGRMLSSGKASEVSADNYSERK